jgi:hypothetical protein
LSFSNDELDAPDGTICANVAASKTITRRMIMGVATKSSETADVTTIGLHLAKNVFQAHGRANDAAPPDCRLERGGSMGQGQRHA